jgi:hypothetical protein
MKVIRRNVGEAIEPLYHEVERRLGAEGESRRLEVVNKEDGALSSVRWRPDCVTIALRKGIPTHALPHVLAVALQHVRQRLDGFPDVVRSDQPQPDGVALARTALRELVLAPEAEQHLASLELDDRWESEQRHKGLKQLLRDAGEDWNEPGTPAHQFAALSYARYSLQHPPEMWESLGESMREQLPKAAEAGDKVLTLVKEHGWKDATTALKAMTEVRDALQMRPYTLVQDRRTGGLY